MSGDERTVDLRGTDAPVGPRDDVTVPETGESGPIAVGAIGRFEVTGSLGEGGMGVVLSAFDPQLDRKVALKVLRPDAVGADGREKLVREARAMAKLSHPNVVAVYDVGDLGTQAFVAMELIDGQDLRAWLRAAPRSWREILAVFVAAGRGLEAAHGAGIVHRDVKPGNILVGRDGRARVGDFGLVGIEPGTIAGTPAYMAPEQARGDSVDARSDQYALCVAMAEAFDGKGAPAWVATAIARGRARDPALRWPSMTELLAALTHDPAPRRRVALAGGGALVLAGVAVWGLTRSSAAGDPCTGAGTRLTGVWDGPRRDAIRAAFAATGAPFADDTWHAVSERFDAYTGAWLDMERDACRATRVEGRQSDSMMDLRMQCLDRRLDGLRALGDVWLGGVLDAKDVRLAPDAAVGLAPLDACADTTALAQAMPLPADPAARTQIASVRSRIDVAIALDDAGRFQDARKHAEAVRSDADATGWAPVRGEAAFAVGKAMVSMDDPKAEQPLVEAVSFGEEARDDRLIASALVDLVTSTGYDGQNTERAHFYTQLAQGAIARMGGNPVLRGQLLQFQGLNEDTAGQYADAERDLEEARRVLVEAVGPGDPRALDVLHSLEGVAEDEGDHGRALVYLASAMAGMVAQVGPDHPAIADLYHSMGNVYDGAGDFPRARAADELALAMKRRLYGETADTALTLSNLGNVEDEQGNPEAAAADYEEALAIREKVLSPDHPFVAMTLGNLGNVRTEQGRYDEARALEERALAIKQKAYGPDDPHVAYALENLGLIALHQGRLADALARTQAAIDIREKKLGRDHEETLETITQRGEIEVKQKRTADARRDFERVVAGFEKVAPKQSDLAVALGDLAELELGAGEAADAAGHLDHAIAILTEASAYPERRAALRALSARALWQVGRHADALAAAQRADAQLVDAGTDGADDLKTLRAWRAKHH